MLNIPTDKYQTSFSGFDPQAIGGGRLTSWMDQLSRAPSPSNIANQYAPAYGQVSGAFSRAREGLPELYSQELQPRTQSALNQLAGRGMLNSTVTSEALANMARNLQRDVGGMQTQLAGQEAGALAQLASAEAAQKASLFGRQNELLASLIPQIGRYSMSQDPLQPYQLMASLMARLMGY